MTTPEQNVSKELVQGERSSENVVATPAPAVPKPHGSPRWSSGGNPEQGEWPSNQHKSPSEAMERLMRGEITTEEYVAGVKRRSHELVEQIKARRPDQERRTREARSALARVRAILRRYA